MYHLFLVKKQNEDFIQSVEIQDDDEKTEGEDVHLHWQ